MMDEMIIKYLSGSASEQERNDILSWLSQSEDNKKSFDQWKDIYEAAIVNSAARKFDADKSWYRIRAVYYQRQNDKVLAKVVSLKHRNIMTIIASIAAILIMALIFGGGMFMQIIQPKEHKIDVFSEVIAPYGSRVTITLPDSTKVWLNAGSNLRYATNFLQNTRDVYLDGEGYFDVKKKQGQQFIVHTSHLNVKVYGTAFNVKAYRDEKIIETTLVRRSIAIEGSDHMTYDFKPVFLKPNQKATFTKASEGIDIADNNNSNANVSVKQEYKGEVMVISPKINPVIYTSWKENRWVIQGEELQYLAIKLERRYDVKIRFEAESLKNYKFSGTLTDETLEQVLNIIKISAPVEYAIENKNVMLKSNKYFKKNYDELLIKH